MGHVIMSQINYFFLKISTKCITILIFIKNLKIYSQRHEVFVCLFIFLFVLILLAVTFSIPLRNRFHFPQNFKILTISSYCSIPFRKFPQNFLRLFEAHDSSLVPGIKEACGHSNVANATRTSITLKWSIKGCI